MKRRETGAAAGAKDARPREPMLPADTIRRLLAMSERGLSRLLSEIPGVQRDTGGRNPQVPLAGLLIALHRRSTRRGAYSPDGEPPDPLLVGGSSPALERYRLARAQAAERENRLAEGQVVERPRVERAFEEIGRLLRIEIEAIYVARPETQGVFEAALERAMAGFVAWSKLNPLSGSGDVTLEEVEGGNGEGEGQAADHRVGRTLPAQAVG